MEKILHKFNHKFDLNQNVVISRTTLNQMLDAFEKMESAISTIEILTDKKAMKAIKASKEDIKHGRYVEGSIKDLDKVMAE